MQVAMTIAFALMLGAAQAPADVRQLFDSGRYQDVVKANDQAAPENERTSRLRYLTAQSYAKLNDGDAARRTYQRLAESGASPWASIGKSAVQLMDKQLDQSLESANQAVRAGDSLPEAHYQRGIVLMSKTEYGEAAGAFARATQLDPTFAAAHYYGGPGELPREANRPDDEQLRGVRQAGAQRTRTSGSRGDPPDGARTVVRKTRRSTQAALNDWPNEKNHWTRDSPGFGLTGVATSARSSANGVCTRRPTPAPARRLRRPTSPMVANAFPASKKPTPRNRHAIGNRSSWLNTNSALPPAGSPNTLTGPSVSSLNPRTLLPPPA